MFQFQCVTWKLEKALANFPHDDFDITEEVKEQVDLVTAQLRRATEKYGGPLNSILLHRAFSQPLDKEVDPFQPSIIDHEVSRKVEGLDEVCETKESPIRDSSTLSEICVPKGLDCARNNSLPCKNREENKKPDNLVIPDDFLCPISLELMRDPVIVATGQTYERSYIQRWIDCGNRTCPKTQQKLHHLTLTPNYVLRSLISQWCLKHKVLHPTPPDPHTDDLFSIFQTLVHRISSSSPEECRKALSEIRSFSKTNTDNRILLAEAGAIPILVNLLSSDNSQIQENAVTCILNLSIYENNKRLIMLANAIPSIVQLLRSGKSMEARENAAATLFSLSFADENKIIIGASGAISALVNLLEKGSSRGKKDAATALFNLCIYHGNKGRAVRAGIINGLMKMLTGSCMVDEALAILSVLAGHPEAKMGIVKANMMPVLVSLLRTGLPRGKENAAAVLFSLCKRDSANLACLSRLGGMVALMELEENGTERAKRKALSLLEDLRRFQKRSELRIDLRLSGLPQSQTDVTTVRTDFTSGTPTFLSGSNSGPYTTDSIFYSPTPVRVTNRHRELEKLTSSWAEFNSTILTRRRVRSTSKQSTSSHRDTDTTDLSHWGPNSPSGRPHEMTPNTDMGSDFIDLTSQSTDKIADFIGCLTTDFMKAKSTSYQNIVDLNISARHKPDFIFYNQPTSVVEADPTSTSLADLKLGPTSPLPTSTPTVNPNLLFLTSPQN
ncbi:U-box domain-containing protein 11 [Striga hermonthica]|uniref:RING-type E3 ubiquitin transferase n=1 Tax=Striga hermonthica TaxID=68872 RepID=A0A9N7RBK9_STRHE|nr:U-box domain-containing protein 11 [Striga hermonthica]